MAVDEPTHPRSVGLVVVLFGIWFFVALQILFWWTIASKEVQHAIAKKTATLHVMRDVLRQNGLDTELLFLDSTLAHAETSNRRLAIEAGRTQGAQNMRRTVVWLFPVLGVITVMLLGCVVYNLRYGHRMSFGHWMGMVLVLLSYAPEVLLFVFVVNRFHVIGDFDLLRHGLGLVPS
jgi:hypothetical protein